MSATSLAAASGVRVARRCRVTQVSSYVTLRILYRSSSRAGISARYDVPDLGGSDQEDSLGRCAAADLCGDVLDWTRDGWWFRAWSVRGPDGGFLGGVPA
jgi:hypothetical protein